MSIQFILVTGSVIFYDSLFPLAWLYMFIAFGVVVNFLSHVLIRKKRTDDQHVLIFLFFDLLQWTAFLSIMGGLYNPFAAFLIMPVILAGGYVDTRKHIMLTLIMMMCLTFLIIPTQSIKAYQWFEFSSFIFTEYTLSPLLYENKQIISHWLIFLLFSIFVLFGFHLMRLYTEKYRWADISSSKAFEQFQQSNAIGTIATAAVHELGTPLNTIQLIVQDMKDYLGDGAEKEDIEQLLEQTEKCKEILFELSHFRRSQESYPLDALGLLMTIEKIAASYQKESIGFSVFLSQEDKNKVHITWTVEVSYVIRNVLQNAFQFANSEIDVSIAYKDHVLTITVQDDGPGFEDSILKKIGTPYVSGRSLGDQKNHMGLGLFVAKSLAEQTHGDLQLLNRPEGGAKVILSWRMSDMYKRTKS